MCPRIAPLLSLLVASLLACSPADDNDSSTTGGAPAKGEIILATTTSTQDSGLLDTIVPIFEEESGYTVKTIAVGTGEALAMGRRGDADVVLAHAPELERESVAGGFTMNRRLVMHNDFLIVGPESDPAGVAGTSDAAAAMQKIAAAGAPFTSRGDNSGTHFLEMKLWENAGVEPAGDWYTEAGQGMGATLQIANERDTYTLVDRGTYLAFKERIVLRPAVVGDPLQLNLYSVMEVNPEKFENINNEGARAFGDFLLSPETQERIRTYGVDEFGEPLFFPDGGKTEEELTNT